MASLFKEIVTFGAAGRIEEAVSEYEYSAKRAQRLARKVESRRTEVAVVLDELTAVKVRACLC